MKDSNDNLWDNPPYRHRPLTSLSQVSVRDGVRGQHVAVSRHWHHFLQWRVHGIGNRSSRRGAAAGVHGVERPLEFTAWSDRWSSRRGVAAGAHGVEQPLKT